MYALGRAGTGTTAARGNTCASAAPSFQIILPCTRCLIRFIQYHPHFSNKPILLSTAVATLLTVPLRRDDEPKCSHATRRDNEPKCSQVPHLHTFPAQTFAATRRALWAPNLRVADYAAVRVRAQVHSSGVGAHAVAMHVQGHALAPKFVLWGHLAQAAAAACRSTTALRAPRLVPHPLTFGVPTSSARSQT